MLLALLPLLVVVFCFPQVPLILGFAALPLSLDIVGGAVHLTLADVLLAFAVAAAIPPLLLHAGWRARLRGTGPLFLAAAPFTVWLIVVTCYHASLTNVLKTGQYLQLFLLPILLGAAVVGRRSARIALVAFVVASVLLAVMWTTTGGAFTLAENKNPSGQLIADAVILTFALAPSLLLRLAISLPLLIGLGFTESRGAILAAGVGVAVVVVLNGLGSWRRTVAAVVPLVFAVGVGYQVLPPDIQARTIDYSSGSTGTSLADLSAAQYAVRLREIYRQNGWKLVNANPVFGVGPGNYTTGRPGSPEQNTDPHDLIIRTAGDSGYPGLIGFGVLVLGSGLLLLKRRRVNPYVVVALAVQASLITHGFVDVYWVRGTPVIGWLLVGMAMNRRLDKASESPSRDHRGVPPRKFARSLPCLSAGLAAGVGDRQLQ